MQATKTSRLFSCCTCRSFERLLFVVEQAWWHYEVQFGSPRLIEDDRSADAAVLPPAANGVFLLQDHVREKPENANLKSLTLKEFTGLIFEKVRPTGALNVRSSSKRLLAARVRRCQGWKRSRPAWRRFMTISTSTSARCRSGGVGCTLLGGGKRPE